MTSFFCKTLLSRFSLLLLILTALLPVNPRPASGATLYWDGTTTIWHTVSAWSTSTINPTPDPATFPGASDIASFNTFTVNTAQNVSLLSNTRSIAGLAFHSTGSVAINFGTLNIGSSGISTIIGTGPVTLNANLALTADQSWTNNSTSTQLTISNNVNIGTSHLTADGPGNITIGGNISGTDDLTKSGNGTLTLSGTNTYSGTLIIESGAVVLGGPSALNSGIFVVFPIGGTLSLNGNSVTIGGLGNVLDHGIVQNSSPTPAILTINNNVPGSYGGILRDGVGGGALALIKSGSGTLDLTTVNTCTGGFTLSAGTVRIENTGALGTGNVAFNGGTLQALTTPRSIANSITLGGDATIGGNALNVTFTNSAILTGNRTLNIADATTTFSGSIGQDIPGRSFTKTGAGTLTLSGTNTFTGTLIVNAGVLTQDGGALASNVINNATFIYNAGTFSGRLVQNGVLTLKAEFTAANGIEFDAPHSIPTGQIISLGGLGLDNTTTLTMAGGTLNLSAAGNAANINRGFFNLFPNVPFNLNAANLANTGFIQVNSSTISGSGTLTNNPAGAIVGPGTISATFSNAGLILDSSGTLTITGMLLNQAGGQIAAPAGGTIFITTGLATNAGLILLSGGTFNNNANPMTNTGTLQGYGTFSFGGSGLTNNGNITFTGGSAIINGPVTNNAGHTILVSQTPATFNGPVVNFGTFVTVGTTINFLGGYTEHGTFHIDPTSANFNGLSILAGASITAEAGDAIAITGNSTLANAGTFSNAGSLAAQTATNSGTFTQSGPQSWAPGSTFTNDAGSANFATNTGSNSTAPLSILINAGTLTTSAPQHLNSLSFAGTPNNWTGKLDLTNQSMIAVSNTANIPNQLKQAANLSAWNGPAGITSSSAQTAAASGTATALAYATGLQFTANNGQTTFNGMTFNPTDVLVMYTLAGDANMDKSVTFADFLQLQNHYNQPSTDWQGGDYNYDSTTTFADFLILQNNYNKTLTAANLLADSPQLPFTNYQLPTTPVPEPASLLLIALALPLIRFKRPLQVPPNQSKSAAGSRIRVDIP